MPDSALVPRDFTASLVHAARLWRRLTRAVMAQHGVGEAAAPPLLWIGRLGEGVRQNALAERIGIEGASLVRVLDDLAAAGMVRREPDPSDRRANLLYLTPRGREVTATVEVDLQALRQRVLGHLGSADLAAAQRVFDAIKATGDLPPIGAEATD